MNDYRPEVLTDAENEEVTAEVNAQLLKLYDDADAAFLEEMPGVKQPQGREALATYRLTEYAYWDWLAATYPERARYEVRRWMALERKYTS